MTQYNKQADLEEMQDDSYFQTNPQPRGKLIQQNTDLYQQPEEEEKNNYASYIDGRLESPTGFKEENFVENSQNNDRFQQGIQEEEKPAQIYHHGYSRSQSVMEPHPSRHIKANNEYDLNATPANDYFQPQVELDGNGGGLQQANRQNQLVDVNSAGESQYVTSKHASKIKQHLRSQSSMQHRRKKSAAIPLPGEKITLFGQSHFDLKKSIGQLNMQLDLISQKENCDMKEVDLGYLNRYVGYKSTTLKVSLDTTSGYLKKLVQEVTMFQKTLFPERYYVFKRDTGDLEIYDTHKDTKIKHLIKASDIVSVKAGRNRPADAYVSKSRTVQKYAYSTPDLKIDEPMSAIDKSAPPDYPYLFLMQTKDRLFYLYAASAEEREIWMYDLANLACHADEVPILSVRKQVIDKIDPIEQYNAFQVAELVKKRVNSIESDNEDESGDELGAERPILRGIHVQEDQVGVFEKGEEEIKVGEQSLNLNQEQESNEDNEEEDQVNLGVSDTVDNGDRRSVSMAQIPRQHKQQLKRYEDEPMQDTQLQTISVANVDTRATKKVKISRQDRRKLEERNKNSQLNTRKQDSEYVVYEREGCQSYISKTLRRENFLIEGHLLKENRSSLATVLGQNQQLERIVCIDFVRKRLRFKQKKEDNDYQKSKDVSFKDITQVRKVQLDIYKREHMLENYTAKFVVDTIKRQFVFFSKNALEREVWVEGFCRILDYNASGMFDLSVASDNYLKIVNQQRTEKPSTKYDDVKIKQPITGQIFGVSIYKSQNLVINDRYVQGTLMKRIENVEGVRVFTSDNNYTERLYRVVFADSMMYSYKDKKDFQGKSTPNKSILLNQIRRCIELSDDDVQALNQRYEQRRSASMLSRLTTMKVKGCKWNFGFCLEITDRTFEFYAPTRVDREKWMQLFNLIAEMNSKLISTKQLSPFEYQHKIESLQKQAQEKTQSQQQLVSVQNQNLLSQDSDRNNQRGEIQKRSVYHSQVNLRQTNNRSQINTNLISNRNRQKGQDNGMLVEGNSEINLQSSFRDSDLEATLQNKQKLQIQERVDDWLVQNELRMKNMSNSGFNPIKLKFLNVQTSSVKGELLSVQMLEISENVKINRKNIKIDLRFAKLRIQDSNIQKELNLNQVLGVEDIEEKIDITQVNLSSDSIQIDNLPLVLNHFFVLNLLEEPGFDDTGEVGLRKTSYKFSCHSEEEKSTWLRIFTLIQDMNRLKLPIGKISIFDFERCKYLQTQQIKNELDKQEAMNQSVELEGSSGSVLISKQNSRESLTIFEDLSKSGRNGTSANTKEASDNLIQSKDEEKILASFQDYFSMTCTMQFRYIEGYLLKDIESKKLILHHNQSFHLRFFRIVFHSGRMCIKEDRMDRKMRSFALNELSSVCVLNNQTEQILEQSDLEYRSKNYKNSKKQMILRKEEIIEKFAVDESQKEPSWPYCLKLQFEKRKFQLYAVSRNEMEQWLRIFKLIVKMNLLKVNLADSNPFVFEGQLNQHSQNLNRVINHNGSSGKDQQKSQRSANKFGKNFQEEQDSNFVSSNRYYEAINYSNNDLVRGDLDKDQENLESLRANKDKVKNGEPQSQDQVVDYSISAQQQDTDELGTLNIINSANQVVNEARTPSQTQLQKIASKNRKKQLQMHQSSTGLKKQKLENRQNLDLKSIGNNDEQELVLQSFRSNDAPQNLQQNKISQENGSLQWKQTIQDYSQQESNRISATAKSQPNKRPMTAKRRAKPQIETKSVVNFRSNIHGAPQPADYVEIKQIVDLDMNSVRTSGSATKLKKKTKLNSRGQSFRSDSVSQQAANEISPVQILGKNDRVQNDFDVFSDEEMPLDRNQNSNVILVQPRKVPEKQPDMQGKLQGIEQQSWQQQNWITGQEEKVSIVEDLENIEIAQPLLRGPHFKANIPISQKIEYNLQSVKLKNEAVEKSQDKKQYSEDRNDVILQNNPPKLKKALRKQNHQSVHQIKIRKTFGNLLDDHEDQSDMNVQTYAADQVPPIDIHDQKVSELARQKEWVKGNLNKFDRNDEVAQNYDDTSVEKEHHTVKISKKRIRLASSSSSRAIRKSIVAELGLSVERLPQPQTDYVSSHGIEIKHEDQSGKQSFSTVNSTNISNPIQQIISAEGKEKLKQIVNKQVLNNNSDVTQNNDTLLAQEAKEPPKKRIVRIRRKKNGTIVNRTVIDNPQNSTIQVGSQIDLTTIKGQANDKSQDQNSKKDAMFVDLYQPNSYLQDSQQPYVESNNFNRAIPQIHQASDQQNNLDSLTRFGRNKASVEEDSDAVSIQSQWQKKRYSKGNVDVVNDLADEHNRVHKGSSPQPQLKPIDTIKKQIAADDTAELSDWDL